MRESTQNELITAEQVDLCSLHSIRTFATKWIDNAPPRRLDLIILCANTITPKGSPISVTDDGVEENWQLNYLANFHLLSILSPAIRAQPPDRDVRILFGTCSAYIAGELPIQDKSAADDKSPEIASAFSPGPAYAASKLALMTFALAFQKHLNTYARPDKSPNNARVLLVDPGYTRTPGMRRYLSWGSFLGLFIYLIIYPFWWLVLKSPVQGAQTFLYAAMEAQYGRGDGGCYVKECREMKMAKADVVQDEAAQKVLWEYSENMVQEAEKRGAKKRAEMKKGDEAKPTNMPVENRDKEAKSTSKPVEIKANKEDTAQQPAKMTASRRSRKA